jgi:hypothetical protein
MEGSQELYVCETKSFRTMVQARLATECVKA